MRNYCIVVRIPKNIIYLEVWTRIKNKCYKYKKNKNKTFNFPIINETIFFDSKYKYFQGPSLTLLQIVLEIKKKLP